MPVLGELNLIDDYYQFARLKSNACHTGHLDLSNETWFYPTSLLPLGIFKMKNPEIRVTRPKDAAVCNYFDIITRYREIMPRKSYIPIINMPKCEDERDKALEQLNDFCSTRVGGKTAFLYFIGELVDNIYEHSSFSTAYIMAQKYEAKRFTEVCIIDDGISIPKSYENTRIKVNSDKHALELALRGMSTKVDKERGHGLRSSVRLITEGYQGTCFIVSGNGVLEANNYIGKTFSSIDEERIYSGTLISTRLPFQRGDVNVYDYVE